MKRLCTILQLHFSVDQFRADLTEEGKKQLKRDAVPSVHVQKRPGSTTSRGRKKCKLSSHTQNLTTEEPNQKERKRSEASSVDTLLPSVKKTKRWTHHPKVEWSYDHLYSKRRRLYFEIVESRVLAGKSGGRNDDPKLIQGTTDKCLHTDHLVNKVEGAANSNAKFW